MNSCQPSIDKPVSELKNCGPKQTWIMESGNGKAVSMTCFRTNRSNGLQLVPEAPSENNSEEKTKTQPILTRGFDQDAFHTYKQTRIPAGHY